MRIVDNSGAGFIGPPVIRHILRSTNYSLVNLDKLTGVLESVPGASEIDQARPGPTRR